MASKKKKKNRVKGRIFLAFIFFGLLISMLSYKLFYSISQINDLKKQKLSLEKKLVELGDEKEVLESDIQKLKNPDYIAKYAREKYLYSKDGELIIRIPDDD